MDALSFKRRPATYGKAVRKDSGLHSMFNVPLSHRKPDVEPVLDRKLKMTSPKRKALSSPRKEPAASHDVFDVPSDYEHDIETTPEKRQRLDSARVVARSIPSPAKKVLPSPRKKPSTPEAGLVKSPTLTNATKDIYDIPSDEEPLAPFSEGRRVVHKVIRIPKKPQLAFKANVPQQSVATSRMVGGSVNAKGYGSVKVTLARTSPKTLDSSKTVVIAPERSTNVQLKDVGMVEVTASSAELRKTVRDRPPPRTNASVSFLGKAISHDQVLRSEADKDSKQAQKVLPRHTGLASDSLVPAEDYFEMASQITNANRSEANAFFTSAWTDLLTPGGPAYMLEVPPSASPPSGAQNNAKTDVEPKLRRRLLDNLVDQSPADSDSEDSGTEEDMDFTLVPNADTKQHGAPVGTMSAGAIGSREHEAVIISASQVSQASQTIGRRVTYSRTRSMLAEQELSEQAALERPLLDSQASFRSQRRGSIPELLPLTSFQEEGEAIDDDVAIKDTVRSVHELRQDGANQRFIHEVGDDLDHINNPASTPSGRRMALLDLAKKFKSKDFLSRFLAHGMDQRLFVKFRQEEDIVSGCIMLSMLLQRAEFGMSTAALAQLRRHGISDLMLRLIDSEIDLLIIAKHRKSNMSKNAISILADYVAFLLTTKEWKDLQITTLTSRLMALKCLERLVRQSRELGDNDDIMGAPLFSKLFGLLSAQQSKDTLAVLGHQTVQTWLILSTLESHSLKVITNPDETAAFKDFMPVIRDVLIAVFSSAHLHKDEQLLALRLTLNLTNNNEAASDTFADVALLTLLCGNVVHGFDNISSALVDDNGMMALDKLVLMLGVMINFAEWSLKCRGEFVAMTQADGYILEAMVRIFTTNHERALEAESMEDSHRNVAFGYLTVLLGFMCLVPEIAKAVRSHMTGNKLGPLMRSLEDFISHHKKVDDLFEEDEDGYNPNAGLTQRLQAMADKLQMM